MDKLKQMESFVAVAQRGSLTAAAQAEGVAPAVISRRLDGLEARLGVKLLARTTRRVSLTHEGSAFLEDCQRLLHDFASAEASVSAGGVKASGHLRVTAPAGFGRRHVAPLVPLFLAEHPDVSISLNLSDRVVDIVNEGVDCAVRVGDLQDSSLVGVRAEFLVHATEREQIRRMKMTENLNSVCPSDINCITRQKLHTSNKISKGIVGSSLKQLARPLLGRPDLATFPAMVGSTLDRLAGRSLTCSGEAGVTIFTQGAQLIVQVTG
jgi:molybdenum-dependent DNA-binding transcriptional regulator ModE